MLVITCNTHACTGPAHPHRIDALVAGVRNHQAGHVEDTNMHSYIFEEQYNSYMRDGYAMAPDGQHMVVNAAKDDNGGWHAVIRSNCVVNVVVPLLVGRITG